MNNVVKFKPICKECGKREATCAPTENPKFPDLCDECLDMLASSRKRNTTLSRPK